MPSRRSLWLVAAPAAFLLLWSGGYAVAKIGLQFAPPMTLLTLRYACVIVAMSIMYFIIRPPLPTDRRSWAHLLLVGFLIQAIYFGMTYLAFRDGVAAGTAALIMSFQPIVVALIAPRWSGEYIGWISWGGLALALVGTILVIVSRSEIEAPSILGFAFAFLGLAGIIIATLWEKKFGLSHHPVTANLIGYAAGLVGVLPLAVVLEDMHVDWSWPFAGALFYLVVGNSLIAVGLLLAMIRAGEVAKVSTLFFLVPPVASLIAWLLLDEVMPPLAWGGMIIAGMGVLIATRKRSDAKALNVKLSKEQVP